MTEIVISTEERFISVVLRRTVPSVRIRFDKIVIVASARFRGVDPLSKSQIPRFHSPFWFRIAFFSFHKQEEGRGEGEEERREGMVMGSYVNWLIYGAGGIVLAGMALLVAFQEKLVYVPVLPGLTKSYPITPARLRLLYEDVWLRSSDGVRLHSWFIKVFPDCRGPLTFPFIFYLCSLDLCFLVDFFSLNLELH